MSDDGHSKSEFHNPDELELQENSELVPDRRRKHPKSLKLGFIIELIK